MLTLGVERRVSLAVWVERWCGKIKFRSGGQVVDAAHLEHWARRRSWWQRPSDVDPLSKEGHRLKWLFFGSSLLKTSKNNL